MVLYQSKKLKPFVFRFKKTLEHEIRAHKEFLKKYHTPDSYVPAVQTVPKKKKGKNPKHSENYLLFMRVTAFTDDIKNRTFENRISTLRKFADIRMNAKTSYKSRRKKTFRPFGACRVCAANKATCQHHMIQLQHGGTNKKWNRIHICDECHSLVHDWLTPRRITPVIDDLTKKYLEVANA